MSAASQDHAYQTDYLNHLLAHYKTQTSTVTASYGATNPILGLGMEVAQALQDQTISMDDLSTAIAELNALSLKHRARQAQGKIGNLDNQDNEQALRQLLSALAQKHTVDTFKKQIETITYGVVFTAHPTFTMDRAGYDHLAAYIKGEDGNYTPSVPDGMTLDQEFSEVSKAIAAARTALERLMVLTFEVIDRYYPDHSTTIIPTPANIANWVGFDLDGRSDISWQSSFEKRLSLALNQQDYYLDYLKRNALEEASFAPLKEAFEAQRRYQEDFLNAFTSTDSVVALEQKLPDLDRPNADILALLTRLISKADADKRPALLVLRALVKSFGNSAAKTHVRLNSTQIHNAIRGLINMEREPDESSVRRNYIQRLSEKFDALKAHPITFNHLDCEPTTARRLFMMIALFKKHIQDDEQIRFLIAETETSFTLLSALFFARYFGVEKNVEISPLFETDVALLKADKVIADLLANPHYRQYVEETGKLCIQVGYSDAGRFVGQVSASMAIERLKIKLLKLLNKEGLNHISLVLFDTHGESIGRGGGQATFGDRVNYFTPPYVRKLAAEYGIALIQETSFQGGDGFLYFDSPDFALATFTRFLETLWTPPSSEEDSFYQDEDTTLEFFLNLKTFNSDLVDHPNYAKLLGAFGQNFLYKTGSRKIKRQHEGKADRKLDHPSQLRAIPHNAILQQIGYLANSLGGFGCSFKKNMDQLVDMHRQSARLQDLASVARAAATHSDIDILHSYISVLDPMIWLHHARVEQNGDVRPKMRRIVRHLEEADQCDGLRSMERLLLRDSLDLKRILDNLNLPTLKAVEKTVNDDLMLLHAIRIGVMLQALLWAMAVPRFTNRPEISMDDVYDGIFHFDLSGALDALKDAFPSNDLCTLWRLDESDRAYEGLHSGVFKNLAEADQLFKDIALGVANQCGGIG